MADPITQMALKQMHKRKDPEAERRRMEEQQKELEEALKDLAVGDMTFAENLVPDEEGYKPITWTQLRRFFSYEKPAVGFKLTGDISQKAMDTWDRSKNIKVRDAEGVEGAVFFYDDDTEPYFSYEDVKVGNEITIRNPRYHRFMDGQEGMRIDEAKNIACVTKKKFSDASRLDYGRLNKDNGNKKFHKQQYDDAMGCYDAAIRHLEGTFYEMPDKEQEAKELVATCYVNIAACHIAEKNWTGVERPCRAALRVNATPAINAKAFYRMGVAFIEVRDITSAASALENAIKLAPGDPAITKEIDRVNELRREGLEAQKAFAAKLKAEHERPFGYRRRLFGAPFNGTLEGVCNFRDVGGLPVSTSGDAKLIVKKRTLYRSANLSHCTANDLDTLVGELGIKTIVDLRHDREVRAAAELQGKRKKEAIEYVAKHADTEVTDPAEKAKLAECKIQSSMVDYREKFIPVDVKCAAGRVAALKVVGKTTKSKDEVLSHRVAFHIDLASRAVMSLCSWWTLLVVCLVAVFYRVRTAARMMVEGTALRVGVKQFYRTLLQKQGPEIAKVVELVSDPANHPVIICCSMGKDRTGICIAVILSAVGVPDSDIIEDYARTSKGLSDEMKQAQEQMGLSVEWNEASPVTMKELLQTIRKECGSCADYLKSIGVTDATLAALKSTLTGPATK